MKTSMTIRTLFDTTENIKNVLNFIKTVVFVRGNEF